MPKRKPKRKKNPYAVALGKIGGKKRVKNQTKAQRSESARRAINARWDAVRAAKGES